MVAALRGVEPPGTSQLRETKPKLLLPLRKGKRPRPGAEFDFLSCYRFRSWPWPQRDIIVITIFQRAASLPSGLPRWARRHRPPGPCLPRGILVLSDRLILLHYFALAVKPRDYLQYRVHTPYIPQHCASRENVRAQGPRRAILPSCTTTVTPGL